MGLSTVDVVDVRFHVINLDQGQKSESVLINFLVLFYCVNYFHSQGLSFPIFQKTTLGYIFLHALEFL